MENRNRSDSVPSCGKSIRFWKTMRDSDNDVLDDSDVDFDPITERYHLSFEPDQMAQPGMIVVYLVSHITERSPLSLPQLQEAIDSDSLRSWLSTSSDHPSDLTITFRYAGYLITLNQTGEIWAELVDETTNTTN